MKRFIWLLFVFALLLVPLFFLKKIDAQGCEPSISLNVSPANASPGDQVIFTTVIRGTGCDPGDVTVRFDLDDWNMWGNPQSSGGWTDLGGGSFQAHGFPGTNGTLQWTWWGFMNEPYTCSQQTNYAGGSSWVVGGPTTSNSAVVYAAIGTTLTNSTGSSHSYNFQYRNNVGTVVQQLGPVTIGAGASSGPAHVGTLNCSQNPHSSWYSRDGGPYMFCGSTWAANGCQGNQITCTDTAAPPTATPVPGPGAPSVISFSPSCGSGSTKNMTINFSGGSGATYHQIVYGVGCYTCSQQTVTVSNGQTITGFNANLDIYYNVQACNSGGCTLDPNGYYISNTGAACSGPTPTFTPTPTTSSGGTCSGICGGATTPPGSCTPSGGAPNSGTWHWVGGEPPYTSTCGGTGSTPYCYTCVGTAPTPTPGGSTTLSPDCPITDNDGRPNECHAAFSCSFGYSYKNSAQADNDCTLFVPLDPTCPNTDLDGRPNQCVNSCTAGFTQKGGAADAACQAAGLGSMCCHNYAPKWCCHNYPPATPTPVQCGVGICGVGQNCATCPIGCGTCPPPPPTATPVPTRTPTPTPSPTPATFTISGNIYLDNNSNGIKDAGEASYTGANATISIPGRGSKTSDASGNYSFTLLPPATYTVSLSTVPVGYMLTSSSPLSRTVGPNSTANFGIKAVPPPACPGGISPAGPTNLPPGGSVTLSVTSCTDVKPTPTVAPPPPFVWTPDTGGLTPTPIITSQTDTPTSSTVIWTAPSCPTSANSYRPQVAVTGFGGTTNYSTTINVPSTYTVSTNIRKVADASACSSSSGDPYTDSTVSINMTGGSLPPGGTTQQTSTGSTDFTCLVAGDYQVTLGVPSGYSVVGVEGGTQSGLNGITLNSLSSNTTATFCIAPTDPWFQTDLGDVRFLNLSNPIPLGKYGSSDPTYPGIYYSSDSNAHIGYGAVSIKNWLVNNEYVYNANTENRNGGVSYDFYKYKTQQDGVTVTPISAGTLDINQITGSGVYESPGDLTINNYNHVNGRRVVLLVNGNVTIATPIKVPVNQGFVIVAAKGDITISKTLGSLSESSTTTQLDGFYSAEGSINIDGDKCVDQVTPDLRLNVGGALIANAQKPFSSTGTGTINNLRSLCTDNLLYPSLYISSRPDFLTQMTDFYKTSYTKWQEVAP